MKDALSPKELSAAIGVSESTLKRWADDGKIVVHRTAGGHRRIAYAEAVRFIRDTHAPVVLPEVLGLPAGSDSENWIGGRSDEPLFDALVRGEGDAARGLVVAAYLTGRSLPSLMDGPIRTSLARIGDLWKHDADGVFVEHRATDLCMQIVNHLRLLAPYPAPDAPVALGGSLAGDPYIVPSLMAATVLSEAGYRVVNLGADTPYSAFERAAMHYKPRLIWLSLSVVQSSVEHWQKVIEFAKHPAVQNTMISLGGRGFTPRPKDRPAFPPKGTPLPANVRKVESMAELAALGAGLRAGV